MTKKRRVYLTDLAAYNEGLLVGRWVELPMDEEDLQREIKEVLVNGYEAAQKLSSCGCVEHEEYFITDHENLSFLDIDQYSNIFAINEKLKELEEFNGEEEVLEVLIENFGLDETLEIIYEGNYSVIYETENLSFNKDGNLAYIMYQEGYLGLEIPESLEYYFDWERYERDLKIEASFFFGDDFAVQVY